MSQNGHLFDLKTTVGHLPERIFEIFFDETKAMHALFKDPVLNTKSRSPPDSIILPDSATDEVVRVSIYYAFYENPHIVTHRASYDHTRVSQYRAPCETVASP